MATTTKTMIEYPSSDGQPMAETQIHVDAIIALHDQLRRFYAQRDDVLITADLLWYWIEGDTNTSIAPDIMVIPGVPSAPPRRTFNSFDEGVVPALVVEFASQNTWRADLGKKFDTYEELGVREYFIFDPEGRYLVPVLQGYRLRGTAYRRIWEDSDSLSTELGFCLQAEGATLRMIDSSTQQRVLTSAEWAENERQRAENERRRAENEKSRADQLQAENERLRAMLQKYGHTNGNGS